MDDRSQPRINVEAEAVLTILRLVELGHLQLLSSEALQFETDRIPDIQRQTRIAEMLKLATHVVELNDEIETQADVFIKASIKPLDALHLASAAWTKADYFCTCDDSLLKKSSKLKGLSIQIVSPLQLIAEVVP